MLPTHNCKVIKNKCRVIKINTKPNPVVKLLFQVWLSPQERAALAIALIKAQLTRISMQAKGPGLLELGSSGPWAELTAGWEQEADGYTQVNYTPQFPDFDCIPLPCSHHILRTREMAQEPQSDLGQVPLLPDGPGANLVCTDRDALCRDQADWRICPHLVSMQHSLKPTSVFQSVWNSHLDLLQLWKPMKSQWEVFYKSWSQH